MLQFLSSRQCCQLFQLFPPLSPFFFFVRADFVSAVLLSQSTVSSSRAAKPNVPFGGWYRRQDVSMWSAVCSSIPHLQFAEGTKTHCALLNETVPSHVVIWRDGSVPFPLGLSPCNLRNISSTITIFVLLHGHNFFQLLRRVTCISTTSKGVNHTWIVDAWYFQSVLFLTDSQSVLIPLS